MSHLLDACHGSAQRLFNGGSMANVIFRCPATGQFVQQAVDEEPDRGEHFYLPVICPACGKMHFVTRNTYKLLGHENE